MAWSPESDGLTSSYCWSLPDELDFSDSSFTESDDYDYLYSDDYEFDTDPELTDLISSRKYFATRVPFRGDGNPRGKFPRKPLPWPAPKLSAILWYKEEADGYRNRLWQWEVEQKRKRQRNHGPYNMPKGTPEDLEYSISSTAQDKIVSNEPKTKHGERSPHTKINRRNKANKTKARKQKIKAQRVRDKNKPRIEKPHYLLALDAIHRKKGSPKIWVGCPICNKIMAEWDGFMRNKSRDLGTRRQDGLWEAKNDCVALDIFDDDRSAFRGCDCGSCWLGSPIDPDYDRAHVEMSHVVDYVDSLGWEAFRVRYVDHIGRRRKVKEARGLDLIQEKDEVEVPDIRIPDINISIEERTEDTESTKISGGIGSDTMSEDWDLLDEDNLDGCSIHGDARPDTVNSSKETSSWATYRDTQRSGWTTNWILGRWFG